MIVAVAVSMSNALNYREQLTILQSQPVEMATNTQEHLAAMPLQQISQTPPTTQIQILESSRPNNEGGEKVPNEFQSQVKQLMLGGILWIYNKWKASENISLDVFIPNNQINKYLKNNLIGVFLLSIVMYDKMKPIDEKLLYDIMHNWISINISAEIIKRPQFVLALTIAIVMVICSNLNHSYDDFFNHVHVKLLNCYIRFEPLLLLEIQAREVQCLCGIQLMSASLQHPGRMVLKLFHKLYQDGVISKESFELFIKKYEETVDL